MEVSDAINKKEKIFVEVKNKFNTVTGMICSSIVWQKSATYWSSTRPTRIRISIGCKNKTLSLVPTYAMWAVTTLYSRCRALSLWMCLNQSVICPFETCATIAFWKESYSVALCC